MSEIRETKKVTEAKEIITGHKCDGCGMVVNGALPKDWFNFSSGHRGWGNDSFESFKYYDVCSPKCFIDTVERALKELRDYAKTADIAEMPYEFAKKLVEAFNPSPNPPAQ